MWRSGISVENSFTWRNEYYVWYFVGTSFIITIDHSSELPSRSALRGDRTRALLVDNKPRPAGQKESVKSFPPALCLIYQFSCLDWWEYRDIVQYLSSQDLWWWFRFGPRDFSVWWRKGTYMLTITIRKQIAIPPVVPDRHPWSVSNVKHLFKAWYPISHVSFVVAGKGAAELKTASAVSNR